MLDEPMELVHVGLAEHHGAGAPELAVTVDS